MTKRSLAAVQGVVFALMLLCTAFAHAQSDEDRPGITPSTGSSGFESGVDSNGGGGWVVDGLMDPFRQAQSGMQSTGSGGGSNSIGERLGLGGDYLGTGIGGQFLGTLLGTDVLNRSMGWFSEGASVQGTGNAVFGGLLQFGTYLGVLFTSMFLIVHTVVAFFNKMEYGDIMGQAKDRFIGGFRAVVAFGLIMPISAAGVSGATHGVAFVAVASNGIGNKAAEVVVDGGFGAGGSSTSFDFDHDYDADGVSRVFAEGVAQDTCRQYMGTVGASGPEINSRCGGMVSTGSGDLDIDYDPESATTEGDIEYCERVVPKRGWLEDTRYNVQSCVSVVRSQREARNRAKGVLEKYDGDLDNPEAIRELDAVAKDLHKKVKAQVKEINQSAFDDYDGAGDNYLHGAMGSLVKAGGWPVMGLIYAEVGAQIDAVSGIQQASNEGGGFNIDSLESAGSAAKSAKRIVQQNKTIADAVGAEGWDSDVSGGEEPGFIGGFVNWLSDAIGSLGDGFEDMGRGLMTWLFSSLFEDPGPVATHKIGSSVLGGVMGIALAHDVGVAVTSVIPGAGVATKTAGAFFKTIGSKIGGIFSDFAEKSIIVKVVGIYLSLLLGLTLLIASFLVVILPKLPIFFVVFLALEWAIWCAILVFASPLWVALNLTAVGNQPGLFTQRALSGLGVLAYLLLFPTLVVVAVVVSLVAYNLVIPILGMMLLLSFGGGGVASIIGVMTMPFIVLLSMSIGGFVAVSAIMKVPSMITGFLGIQAPGDSVSQQASTFIATPMQFSNVTSPQSLLTQGGQALTKSAGGR